MAYHTPELLLVGAAQNLVLGVPKAEIGPSVNYDNDMIWYTTGNIVPFDSASW